MTELAAIQSASDAQPAVSDGAPERARARILDIARNDNEKAADAAQRERDNALRAEVVGKAVPEQYLKLVDEMRDAVQLFNQSLRPPEGQSLPLITWVETPNVALRDPNTGDGMRIPLPAEEPPSICCCALPVVPAAPTYRSSKDMATTASSSTAPRRWFASKAGSSVASPCSGTASTSSVSRSISKKWPSALSLPSQPTTTRCYHEISRAIPAMSSFAAIRKRRSPT